MSTDSLALLRKNAGQEISALAGEHIEHDLQDSDRDLLNSAASKFSTHVKIGSLLGLSLGALLAFRLRRTRMQMFRAFRAQEKPSHVRFADGREGKSSGRLQHRRSFANLCSCRVQKPFLMSVSSSDPQPSAMSLHIPSLASVVFSSAVRLAFLPAAVRRSEPSIEIRKKAENRDCISKV